MYGRIYTVFVFLGQGPIGPRRGVFFTNIQHPVCIWTYKDHDLTTYYWLSRGTSRYTNIPWCLFLSINAPKIKSCRLVEKRRAKVYRSPLASLYLDFQLKANRVWLKLKIDPGARKKLFRPEPGRVWTCPQLPTRY